MAAGTGTIFIVAVVAAILGSGKKKKKKKKVITGKKVETPPVYDEDHCGLFPWLPDDVDEVAWQLVDQGWENLEEISIEVAREVYTVTPEGGPQQWPPPDNDARAQCILDRIRIRVNLILAEKADQEADGEKPDRAPKPEPVPDDSEYGDYPEPGPIDLDTITHPENYPEPGTFHQVGGPNSATTTKHIAQKALMQAHYSVFQDSDAAKAFSDDSENWRRYRELMDCSPFNDAFLGARHTPGGGYWYDTPTGRQIAMMPVHDALLSKMAYGEVLERRVDMGNPQKPPGGQQPAIWLPPLDVEAMADGRVELDPEYWETGDSKILPPPEVLVLVDPHVSNIPPNQLWGCLGYELEIAPVHDFHQGETQSGFHHEEAG